MASCLHPYATMSQCSRSQKGHQSPQPHTVLREPQERRQSDVEAWPELSTAYTRASCNGQPFPLQMLFQRSYRNWLPSLSASMRAASSMSQHSGAASTEQERSVLRPLAAVRGSIAKGDGLRRPLLFFADGSSTARPPCIPLLCSGSK
ncbi:uncharacterized protein LOC144123499 [Amblyomma americanum]